MSEDDEAVRIAKAASLGEHINRLPSSGTTHSKEDSTTSEPTPSEDEPSAVEPGTVAKESPRDFVRRRMHELDKKKQ